MKQIQREVSQETVDYLERLQYEIMSREEIIAMLIERNSPEVLEGDAFQTYSAQLAGLKAEYELAKTELERTYVPKALEGHQYRWNLDFKANILYMEALCACGAEALSEAEADHEAQ